MAFLNLPGLRNLYLENLQVIFYLLITWLFATTLPNPYGSWHYLIGVLSLQGLLYPI